MHFYKYHLGLTFDKAHKERRLHDTMLQHYVLDERRGTHGLKSLAMKYTDMGDYDFELDKFKEDYCKAHKIKKEDFTYDLIPFDIMWPYATKIPMPPYVCTTSSYQKLRRMKNFAVCIMMF